MVIALPMDVHRSEAPPPVQAAFNALKTEAEALIAAGADRAKGPQPEPDRSVWRVLSHGVAARVELTDEQLRAALPAFSLDELAAARLRVAVDVEDVRLIAPPQTLAEILAQPFVSNEEAEACGLS